MVDWNPEANAIFLEAHDLHLAESRRTYLDQACGDNTGLRAQVEALLAASERAGRFLEQPAVAQVAAEADRPKDCTGARGACRLADAGARARLSPVDRRQTRAEQPVDDGDGQSLDFLERELIPLELSDHRSGDDVCRTKEYRERFPALDAAWLAEAVADSVSSPGAAPATAPGTLTEANTPAGEDGTAPDHAAGRLQAFGDYELLEEIARGGMGVVYKARQVSLNRLVALKMILSGQLASAEDVRRFRREAEAAANLDHPNIVPIHEVGEQDGQHYFSMKLIDGGSLSGKVPELVDDPKAAVRILAAVARAVHFAHQHGVLHRDLKPANILLDAAGQPHVTDFGLAKRLTGEAGLTQLGAIVGTPSYMPPEQAAGRKGLSTAADVYSLGAILYELLTGRPPFRAGTPLETLLQVLEKEPQRPRALNRAVDRDLETVCLKCLEKAPERRYPSAAALADDLERWQAGEPISARAVGHPERLWRWCRRNRGVAALLALLVLVVSGALVSVTSLWLQADRQRALAHSAGEAATQARDQAEANLRLARANFSLAQKAVEDTATKIAEEPRLRETDFHPLRRDLLASAVPFYEQFVKQQSDDPELEAERGRAYWRLAIVRHEMGEEALALADYERMRSIFQLLAARYPEVPSYRSELAGSQNSLGVQLSRLERLAEAEAAFQAAIQVGERLADEFPTEPGYRLDMVARYNNLGTVLKSTGRLAEAEAALRKALAIQEQFSAGRPAEAALSEHLAASYHNLGALLDSVQKVQEAEAAFRASLKIRAQLAAAFPTNPDGRENLACSYKSLGIVLSHAGRLEEAKAACRNALQLREELAGAFPTVPEYRRQLAGSHNSLGTLLYASHEDAEAATARSAARAIWEKLVADFPGVPAYAVDLGGSYCNLGNLLEAQGQPQAALDWYDKAIRTLAPVLAREGRLVDARRYLRNTHQSRASALTRLRRYADSFKDWDRALELAEGAARHDIRILRAVAWAHAGEMAKAAVEADDLTAGQGVPDHILYDAACIHALAAAKAEGEAAAAHTAQAVALLRRAKATGYFRQSHRLEHVKKDPDLHALHDRASFRKFVAELE